MAWRIEVRERFAAVNETLLAGARPAAVRAATRLVREMRERGVPADQVLEVIQEENPSFGVELRRLFTRLRLLLDEAEPSARQALPAAAGVTLSVADTRLFSSPPGRPPRRR